MTLLLISKTPIIKQIFNLVSKKLNIEITTLNICVVNKNYDLIIIEDICFDNSFPASDYTDNFGIIAKGATNKKSDFVIQKPFLPATLMSVLQTKLDEQKNIPTKINDIQENSDEALDSVEYIDDLASDISDEIIEEDDESIVNSAFLGKGGVLDSKELLRIQNLLDYSTTNEQTQEEDGLSDIIDKVIQDVKETTVKNEAINLTINQSNISELSSLLNILGQNVVDDLTNGKEIILKLQLDKHQ
jgi:hypothetical protein